MKNQLIKLIQEKALSFNKTTLSSGQTSDYYIDLSKITMNPNGLQLIISLIDTVVNWGNIHSVGGPATGAIPIIAGILMKRSVNGFFVRKEVKGHGKEDLIEGYLEAGNNVIMVEDVITSGKSLYKAIIEVESRNCRVVQVISVVDRQQGARELINLPFKAILNIEDIL